MERFLQGSSRFQNPRDHWNYRKGFQHVSVYITHFFTSPLAIAIPIFEKFATERGLTKVPTVTETGSPTKSRHPSFSATVFSRITCGQLVLSCCTAIVYIPTMLGYRSWCRWRLGLLWVLGVSLEAQQLLPVPGTYGIASCSDRWMLPVLREKS